MASRSSPRILRASLLVSLMSDLRLYFTRRGVSYVYDSGRAGRFNGANRAGSCPCRSSCAEPASDARSAAVLADDGDRDVFTGSEEDSFRRVARAARQIASSG